MPRFANGQVLTNQDVIQRMDDLIASSLRKLQELIPDAPAGTPLSDDETDIIARASQANAGEAVYDEETFPFYLCRYGKAYIYEYTLIYDMLLRMIRYDRVENVNMLSLGCGSLIDALSMVMASANLNFADNDYINNPAINYTGVDLAQWNEFCVKPDGRGGENNDPIALRFDSINFFREDMIEFLRRNYPDGSNFDKNVIVFPKVLNTIGNDLSNQLLDRFENLNFPNNEYYIVVSHAVASAGSSMATIDRLINKINRNNEFNVSSDLESILGDNKWRSVHNKYVGGRREQPDIDPNRMLIAGNESLNVNSDQNCYIFSGNNTIASFRREFFLEDVFGYLRQLSDRVNDRDMRVMPITHVDNFVFEIVKLKRR